MVLSMICVRSPTSVQAPRWESITLALGSTVGFQLSVLIGVLILAVEHNGAPLNCLIAAAQYELAAFPDTAYDGLIVDQSNAYNICFFTDFKAASISQVHHLGNVGSNGGNGGR